jgi:hypothetical protein
MKKKFPGNCWYIAGFCHPSLLAIKVKWTARDPVKKGDLIFGDISEPIGHSITEDELLTKRQAIRELELRKQELPKRLKTRPHKNDKSSSLHRWRRVMATFILGTQGSKINSPKQITSWLAKHFPDEKNVEWFA